jgi:hypothetical protein
MSSFAIPHFEKAGAHTYPIDNGNNRLSETGYHSYEVMVGEDNQGELVLALVGIAGALRYPLSYSYTPLFDEGYQGFEVREGVVFGQHGGQEENLGSWPPANIDQ